MKRFANALLCASALSMLGTAALAETLTIATVNNGDMIRMQALTDDFTAKHPGIELNWVTQDVLLQRHHRHRHPGRSV